MADTTKLGKMYEQAAAMCVAEGVENDAEPCGALHRWVVANVTHRPDTAFFIVQGIAAAMADLDAQEQGYRDQGDRAAALMRESDAFKKYNKAKLQGLR